MGMPWDDFFSVMLVGCLSGALGTGASLALPAMFALGMPAATALLAFKLPLAVADIAAAACLRYRGLSPNGELVPQLAMAAATAAGAVSMLFGSPWSLPCALCVVLLLPICARRGSSAVSLVALGSWIGVCGVGAGLALLAFGRREGDSLLEATARARALGAAANLAAVAVIAMHANVPWTEVLNLTLALAVGSGLGACLAAQLGRTGINARRHLRSIPLGSMSIGRK